MSVINKLNGKRILIWGYGREGKSTENFLNNHCTSASVQVFEGKLEDIAVENYDYIIKSPGIPALHLGEQFLSQTKLFLEEFSGQVIGITGTKGKSTTSTMLYETLKACLDRPVLLVGNIGLPCLDYYDEITEDTVIVFELSCHQLADCTISPHIGVFLNLYEEHLDYYKELAEYFKAKCNVAANQTTLDVAYIGEQVPPFETKGRRVIISPDEKVDFRLNIPGAHNQYDAEFVRRIAVNEFGCEEEQVKQVLSEFTGLPHRLQYIGTVEGVEYYDDSISTIPEATIAAAGSIPRVKTIILGGMDRHIEYTSLVTFIRENPDIRFILAYETGARIYEEAMAPQNCYLVSDLKEAVTLAKQITPSGMSCVLSPAAASYGYFKNFEERGERFQEFVQNTKRGN